MKNLLVFAAAFCTTTTILCMEITPANVNQKDEDGYTQLEKILYGYQTPTTNKSIASLLEMGAHPNTKSGPCNITPLHLAASANNYAAVELLLNHRADVDAKVSLSENALDFAIKGAPVLKSKKAAANCCKTISLLVEHGAKFSEKTYSLLKNLGYKSEEGSQLQAQIKSFFPEFDEAEEARKESIRQDAMRQEVIHQEAMHKAKAEAARLEALRKTEETRRETIRKTIYKTVCKEAARQGAIHQEAMSQTTCLICLEEEDTNNPLQMLPRPCGKNHPVRAHAQCIESARERKNECPYCRARLRPLN